jgi:hypothetical protein
VNELKNKPEYLPGQKLEDGTLYVGVITSNKKTFHLSLEEKEYGEMTWHEAVKLEGLPSIYEMNLISANSDTLGLSKESRYCWSSMEVNGNFAWYQRFADGYQGSNYKNNTLLVRCVRRYLIIQPFDNLKLELETIKNRIVETEGLLK